MQMVGHDHELIKPQAFVLSAIRQVIQKELGILASGEYVHPAHHRKSDEVGMALNEFVALAHRGKVMPWMMKARARTLALEGGCVQSKSDDPSHYLIHSTT